MNKHIFADNLTARAGALIAGKSKFFFRSIDSASFEELARSVEVSVPAITGEGTFELVADTPDGPLGTAFRVEKWAGSGVPTLIYHHGNNERPFDYRKGAKNTFLNIFVKERDAFPLNLLVVRAPCHDLPLKEYQKRMTELKNFMYMITVAVRLNEEIIRSLPKGQPVATAGISLGGWVTNLHRTLYNTSAIYIPLMAGSFLGELFLRSSYRRLTGPLALSHPEKIRELLNFDTAFAGVPSANVFPLLARYDRFIEYEVQKKSYNGYAVRTLEAGHVTGALNARELRSHILQVLEKTGTGSG